MAQNDYMIGALTVTSGALLAYLLLDKTTKANALTGLATIHNVEYSKEAHTMYGLAAQQVEEIVGLRNVVVVKQNYQLDCDVTWQNEGDNTDTFDILVEYGVGPVTSFNSQFATIVTNVSATPGQLQISKVSLDMRVVEGYNGLIGVKNSIVTIGKWDPAAEAFIREDSSAFYESVVELVPETVDGLGVIKNAVWCTDMPADQVLLSVDTRSTFENRGLVYLDGVLQGLSPVEIAVPLGATVTISFSDIGGYSTPAPQTIIVQQAATIIGNYNYLNWNNTWPLGAISVRTFAQGVEITGAPLFMDNVPYSISPILFEIESGQHVISFGEVSGYITPDLQIVTVPQGGIDPVGMIEVIGVYT